MKIYEFAISDKRGKELTEFWKDCLNNNYVRTEWKGIDNFKNININRDLWNLIDKNNPQYKNKLGVNYKFNQINMILKIKEGDIIIARKGITYIKAIGIVTSEVYRFLGNTKDDYRHVICVKWINTYENKRIPKEFTPRRCTLNEISFDTYQKLIEEKTREYIKAFIK